MNLYYNNNYDGENSHNYIYNNTIYQGEPVLPAYFLMMIICIGCGLNTYKLINHLTKRCVIYIKKYRNLKSITITSDDEENLLNDCPICLEQYIKKDKIIELSCNHIFHKKCIKEWIKDNNTCPQCRENIEIKSVETSLLLNCNGDFASQETILLETQEGLNFSKNSNSNEPIQGIFSLKYLCLFTKCTNLCNLLHIYIKNDYPLVIKYDIANLGHIKLCLSPNSETD